MRISTAAGMVLSLGILATAPGCSVIADRQKLNRANKLFAAKQYEQAIPDYQNIVKSDPDNWHANYYVAMSWMAQFHPQSTHPKDAEIKKQAVASLEKLMTLRLPTPRRWTRSRTTT